MGPHAAFVVLPFVFFFALFAGCAFDDLEDPQARVGGTFTADWSSNQTARQDFQATVDKYGGEAVIMESFPEQFAVTLGETDCYLLVQELEDRPYVQSIGACQRLTPANDPDGATSNY